jgi:hypothetical protein
LTPWLAGGILILSGLQLHERDEVMRAFAATSTIWERDVEDGSGCREKKHDSQPRRQIPV